MDNQPEEKQMNTAFLAAKKTQRIPDGIPDHESADSSTLQDNSAIAAISHPGFYRTANEDCYGYHISRDGQIRLLAVADGIGGHSNGDRASKLLIRDILTFWRKICDSFSPGREEEIIDRLKQELLHINNKIYAINVATGIKVSMGSTLALLLLLPGKAVTFHAGDSRIYRFRNETLMPLTEDHSYITEFLKTGTLTKEKAHEHPLAHVILRAIGTTADSEVEVNCYDLESGDIFLVCSDGLTEHLLDDQIRDFMLKHDSPHSIAKELLQKTFCNGAHDNVTILCTKYS